MPSVSSAAPTAAPQATTMTSDRTKNCVDRLIDAEI